MIRTYIFFMILLTGTSCGKSYLSFNRGGFHGSFYTSFEKMQQKHDPVTRFYDFKPGEQVASIGAQTCVGEAVYASFCDSVHFYPQDIDSTYLNAPQAAYVWNYYGTLRGKPLTSNYQLVLGNEKETLLPLNHFDKCLIINSFHEFTAPAAMLNDLYGKLKPGGLLYIDEIVPVRIGELHGVCRMPLYTAAEMNKIVQAAGFKPKAGWIMEMRKNKIRRNIYCFEKAM